MESNSKFFTITTGQALIKLPERTNLANPHTLQLIQSSKQSWREQGETLTDYFGVALDKNA